MLPARRLSRAQAYLQLGMVNEAAEELGQVDAPFRDSPEAVALRLAVLHEQAAWPELRQLAGDLARRCPGDLGAWVSWAYATRRTESLAAATAILQEAERHFPDAAIVQFNLGCYASVAGDLATARRRVQRAIALDDAYAELAATDPDLAAWRAAGGRTDCPPGA